jgi:hypothetical protein
MYELALYPARRWEQESPRNGTRVAHVMLRIYVQEFEKERGSNDGRAFVMATTNILN